MVGSLEGGGDGRGVGRGVGGGGGGGVAWLSVTGFRVGSAVGCLVGYQSNARRSHVNL